MPVAPRHLALSANYQALLCLAAALLLQVTRSLTTQTRSYCLPVPMGSTVTVATALSETGRLMETGRVLEWVSLGGVTTMLVMSRPEPPVSLRG